MARKRKTPPTAEDKEILPLDLLESILAKVPVKSLLQFKTVCKFWNAIISSPHFIKIQSDLALSSSPSRFLVHERLWASSDSRSLCLLNFQDQDFHRESDNLPMVSYSPGILCSCKGIVLLRKHPSSNAYVLLNPCTRMQATIWSHYDSSPVAHGLLHDPTTNDYKIVIVTASKKYSVFSVKKNSWTKRDEEFPSFKLLSPRGVYMDGALYWTHYENFHNLYPTEIIFFDGIHEKCGRLQLPTPITKKSHDALVCGDLTCVRGSLGFCYRYVKSRNCKMVIRMYIMGKNGGEDSYKKLMTLDIRANPCPDHIYIPYCGIRPPCPINDDMIMVFINCATYFIYDAREDRIVGEAERFSRSWDSVLVPCWDQLFFPTDSHGRRPWRKFGMLENMGNKRQYLESNE